MVNNTRDTVIYIGSMMMPDHNAAAQRALALSKSFRNLGYKVVIVGRSKDHNQKHILTTKETHQGFETYSLPQPVGFRQWVHHTVSAKEFIEVIEHYGADRIKCAVVMEYEAIPLAKLAAYCRKRNISVVADALEWFGHSKRRFPENLVKDIDTWTRMHLVYPYCIKNMICISRFLYEHYHKMIGNCVYIPGTIDPLEEKWSNLKYKPNEIFTLGYAGSLGAGFEKERADYLIQAVAELNQEGRVCRLLLAGIDESFVRRYDHLWEAIKQSKGMIVCKGRLSHQESLEMIASCDFSVIVRENKRVTNAGFPTKLSESFGCGTPVLTTRTSNIAEYIPDRQWGIVCDECDVETIKEMIKKAMECTKDEQFENHNAIKNNHSLTYECFNQEVRELFEKLQ